jgi:hypothetical protein
MIYRFFFFFLIKWYIQKKKKKNVIRHYDSIIVFQISILGEKLLRTEFTFNPIWKNLFSTYYVTSK